MSASMTSTELAHALNIDKRTPGCWIVYGPTDWRCLWPLPDSGEPGAELFASALIGAMCEQKLAVILYENILARKPLIEALYAAWRTQEKAK